MVLVGAPQAAAGASAFTSGPSAWAGATSFHEERLQEMAQAAEAAMAALGGLVEADCPQTPSLQAACNLARQCIHT
eukprot:5984554-Alexandrium_andersonii.AAC.1